MRAQLSVHCLVIVRRHAVLYRVPATETMREEIRASTVMWHRPAEFSRHLHRRARLSLTPLSSTPFPTPPPLSLGRRTPPTCSSPRPLRC